MKKIEAPTLNEALLKASEILGVSVCHIEYEIIQEPSKGFLGFGKKEAIIVASTQSQAPQNAIQQNTPTIPASQEAFKPKQEIPSKKDYTKRPSMIAQESPNPHHGYHSHNYDSYKQTPIQTSSIKETFNHTHSPTSFTPLSTPSSSENTIYDNFFQEPLQNTSHTHHPHHEKSTEAPHSTRPTHHHAHLEEIAAIVQQEINDLFKLTPFKIDSITVNVFDSQTLFIEFQGEDSALLIGKEGYRYKALSYMLFNWINAKYGLMIRLEIAEFLKNQEEMIQNYLSPIIDSIHQTGKGQTRPLNGVLAYIALRQLREVFPDKYVSFRINPDGDKYVIVNDFIRNH